MREILFKAKRIDNGEWVEGDLIQKGDSCTKKLTHSYIFNWDGEFEVVPETVSQFTGLTDKNGKKIFEGDIVKEICKWDGANMYVEYYDAQSTFALYDKEKIGFKYLCDIHNREVIGNIFDNPELLESEV